MSRKAKKAPRKHTPAEVKDLVAEVLASPAPRDLSKVRAAGMRRRLRGLLAELEALQKSAASAALQIDGLGGALVLLRRIADAFEEKARGPQVVGGAPVRFASPEAAREHGAPEWFAEDAIGRVVSVTEGRGRARLTKLAAVLFPTTGVIQGEQRIIVRVSALAALSREEIAARTRAAPEEPTPIADEQDEETENEEQES